MMLRSVFTLAFARKMRAASAPRISVLGRILALSRERAASSCIQLIRFVLRSQVACTGSLISKGQLELAALIAFEISNAGGEQAGAQPFFAT